MIDRILHPARGDVIAIASASLDLVPGNAAPVTRGDFLVLDIAEDQSEDHGWTRWWLHARSIPFLGAILHSGPPLEGPAGSATLLIADASRSHVSDAAIRKVGDLITAGATAIAFGASSRLLAEALATDVGTLDLSRRGAFKAPGALVRVQPVGGTRRDARSVPRT